MLLRRTVAATTLPVSMTQALDHLRISESGPTIDGTLIEGLLESACDLVAEMSGRSLAAETWVAAYPYLSGDLRLPKGPVIDVTSVGYFDQSDIAQTLPVTDFYIFTDQDFTVMRPKTGKQWPSASIREDSVSVTFTAGYSVIPAALRAAILLTLGHLYENRESVVIGSTAVTLPLAVETLIGAYRTGWVAA